MNNMRTYAFKCITCYNVGHIYLSLGFEYLIFLFECKQ